MTVPKLKIILGLYYIYGLCRITGRETGSSTYLFLENKFQLILKCLHFNSIEESGPSDQLFKIRFLTEVFNSKMIKINYPSKELSLNEDMVLWGGRLIFHQYIKERETNAGLSSTLLVNTWIDY